LREAQDIDRPRHDAQARQGQFEADREQQECHTQLRKAAGCFDVRQKIETGRTDDQAGGEIPDDGAEAKSMGKGDADDGGEQDDDDVDKVMSGRLQAEILLAIGVKIESDKSSESCWRLAYRARRCYALYRRGTVIKL
jgi:hypothetical protein